MSISKFIQKKSIFWQFLKNGIFCQVLFLLRFGVPRCCFFKSMISQLSFAQKIIKKALLDQKLCQFEVLLWPIYLVIFNVIIRILAAYRAGNAVKIRVQMLKIPNFCDYLRDASSGDKTFLGPNLTWVWCVFCRGPIMVSWWRYLRLWKFAFLVG